MTLTQEINSKIKMFKMETMSVSELKDMGKRHARRRSQTSIEIYNAAQYILEQINTRK